MDVLITNASQPKRLQIYRYGAAGAKPAVLTLEIEHNIAQVVPLTGSRRIMLSDITNFLTIADWDSENNKYTYVPAASITAEDTLNQNGYLHRKTASELITENGHFRLPRGLGDFLYAVDNTIVTRTPDGKLHVYDMLKQAGAVQRDMTAASRAAIAASLLYSQALDQLWRRMQESTDESGIRQSRDKFI